MINLNKYKNEFLETLGTLNDWKHPILNSEIPGYPPNSIFFGEALILYALSKEYEIDCFIESGVYRGGSTTIWCKVFSELKLFSVDLVIEGNFPDKKWNYISTEFPKLYKNISFIRGDGNKILPNVIEENPNKKFGVFVDGPKNAQGVRLMEKCFSYENVMFSSLHDYTHEKYFSTRKNKNVCDMISEIDKNHVQIKKYPSGPGLTVIDKLNLLN